MRRRLAAIARVRRLRDGARHARAGGRRRHRRGRRPCAQQALAWAVKQVGVREVGTSNCSPVIDRWERDDGPAAAALPRLVRSVRAPGLPARGRAALAAPDRPAPLRRRRRRRPAPPAQDRDRRTSAPGDIVFYKFRSGVRASHLALARGAAEGRHARHGRGQRRQRRAPASRAARSTSCSPRASRGSAARPAGRAAQPQSKLTRVSGPWRSSASAVIASTTRRSSSIAGAACSPIRGASRSNAAASSR